MEIKEAYSGTENLEVMKCAFNYNRHLVNLITSFVTSKTKVMLDYGAGMGIFAEKIEHEGYRVVCLEPDLNLSKHLSKRFSVKTDLTDVDKEYWDYIYSLNVLEHIEDDSKALEQIYASLKTQGRFAVYVPAFNLLYSSMDKKVGHFRRYRRTELLKKMKAVGFKPIKAEYVDSMGFFASLIYKYLDHGTGDINTRALIFFDKFIFPASLWFDKFFRYFLGKNLFIVAEK